MKEKLASFGSAWGWAINLFVLPALFWAGAQVFVTKAEFNSYQKSHAEYVGVKAASIDDQIISMKKRQDNMETILIQVLPTLKVIEADVKNIQKQLDQHMSKP